MTENDLLSKVKHVHFIGIGGSGMCPIAEILYHQGYTVTGSDMNESETLRRIRSCGMDVVVGHDPKNVEGAQLAVYTAAARQDNPEIVAAKEKGIPTIERSVMLGMLMARYPQSVAVSGTHGKTTTTGMITQILLEGGMDPSAVIGGKLPLTGTNGRAGKSGAIVCEACEYVDTFLQLHPYISVILNVDSDHLDYFKNLENIIRSFHQFARQTRGLLIVNGDDANAMKAAEGIDNARIVTFGLQSSNDYSAGDITDEPKALEQFSVMKNGKKLCSVSLSVPGRHNILNALAAFAAADALGVPAETIAKAIHSFTGVHRRFEIRGKYNGVTIADDFAHHPTELEATLKAAMRMGFRQVWALFQPHTYSRTAMFSSRTARISERTA